MIFFFFFCRKLYSKSLRDKLPVKRTSAKKKTPGKRKTPKSVKRQLIAHPETSRESTKRALFTNSSENYANSLGTSKDTLTCGKLPRRTLFSPDESHKRKRSPSPDQDAENRERKLRRLMSPTKLLKSQSFSVGPSCSSGSLIMSKAHKGSLYRTQSEIGPQTNDRNTGLGYRKPMTEDVKKVSNYYIKS